MSHPVPVRAARRRIERDHLGVIDTIDTCADRVADRWASDRTTDSRALVESLRRELESMGVLEFLPRVLADAVAATGHQLSASPVSAPPYVIVTSRGPMLRGTIDPGRLVVRFDAFTITDSTPTDDSRTTYRRRSGVELVVSLE